MTDDTSILSPPPEPPPVEPVAPATRSRHIGRAGIVMLIVGALILVVGVTVFAIAVTGAGGKAVAAEAMPPDVDLYMSIDFVNLREVAPTYDAFVASLDDTGTPSEDLLAELDTELDREFGVTLDDLIAWLGRDAAIGLRNLSSGSSFESIPDVVATVSIDDNALAEKFITDVRSRIESEDGVVFQQSQYEGVTVYAADGPTSDVASYAMLDEILIIGSSSGMVEDSIDAYFGQSISDVAEFQDTIASLPGSRAFTLYLNPQLLADMTDLAADLGGLGVPGIEDQLAGLRGLGMSAGAIAEGLRFDIALVTDPAFFDESQLSALGSEGAVGFEDRFPMDTVFYVGSAVSLSEAWDSAVVELEAAFDDTLGSEMGSFDELMSAANEQLGFDIERDLIDHLDGPTGLAMVDAAGGLLAEGFGLDGMGFIGAFGTSDDTGLQRAMAAINNLIVDFGLERSSVEVAGGDFYAASVDGTEAVAFGAGNGFMLVSTSGGLISDFFDDGPKLVDNETYRKAASALGGAPPAMFVDIAGMLAMFDAPADMRDGLRPLLGAAANGTVTPSLSTATLVLVIETAG